MGTDRRPRVFILLCQHLRLVWRDVREAALFGSGVAASGTGIEESTSQRFVNPMGSPTPQLFATLIERKLRRVGRAYVIKGIRAVYQQRMT